MTVAGIPVSTAVQEGAFAGVAEIERADGIRPLLGIRSAVL